MKLADLQSLFQESVLADAPSPRLLALLRPPARADDVAETFAVYHDGFRLRMAEFLANDYPVLREALGDLAFDAMAEAYARARPSKFRNARWFGAGLPDFLRATPPYSSDSFICGLAAIEAGLTQSFDAEDADPLPIAALGAIEPQDWPRLRFGFHPSVVLVEANAPALAAYEAAQAGEAIPEPGFGPALSLVVWRRELDVHYRALDASEVLALLEALAGGMFGDICSLLAFASPDAPENETAMAAGQSLARWFADGMIVTAEAKPD
jgi:hypothetical protein